jgi:hypothetical protein
MRYFLSFILALLAMFPAAGAVQAENLTSGNFKVPENFRPSYMNVYFFERGETGKYTWRLQGDPHEFATRETAEQVAEILGGTVVVHKFGTNLIPDRPQYDISLSDRYAPVNAGKAAELLKDALPNYDPVNDHYTVMPHRFLVSRLRSLAQKAVAADELATGDSTGVVVNIAPTSSEIVR